MSGLNDIYGQALTMPPGPAAEVGDLPEASVQAASTANEVGDLPESAEVPASAVNPVAAFGQALHTPGFPAYLVEPESPAVSVRSGSSSLPVKVQTLSGSPYRVRNHRTGTVSAFTASGETLPVAIIPADWNLLTIEVQGSHNGDVRNFDINQTNPRISGSFVLHTGGHFPRYGALSGASYLTVRLLQLELPESISSLSYWNLSYVNLSAEQIDRLLIAADTATNPTGTLIYSNNPGSADGMRSDAALAALNSLLAKGWTITR